MKLIIGSVILGILLGLISIIICNFVSNLTIEKMQNANIVCKELDKTVVCTENGKVIHSFSSK